MYNSSCKCSKKIVCAVIAGIVLILSACIAEYGYLTSLYLVDEYYDVKIPREISTKDKTTIRIVSMNEAAIISFVSHYSICQCVHEIQVVIPGSNEEEAFKLSKQFVYTKTHSRVQVDQVGLSSEDKYYWMLYHERPVETESISYIVYFTVLH